MTGLADGQVVFEITGDNKGIKQALTDTTNTIKTESKKWDTDVENSSANMTSAFDKALDIKRIKDWGIQLAKELARFGIECIETASDLEEVQNVVDVTFGREGAKKIEKWASEASSKFGLTELQAKRYASTLGAMMKSSGMTEDQVLDMSMNLAGLAADMASFYNMPFDEAFSKIQSGMAGMSMPLRQLGIDMTETSVAAYAAAAGFEQEYSKMSEAEQQMVRYAYLMNATKDAQGDFARTSDSYANSQRRMATGFETLKAQLGEVMLPFATQLSDSIADLLEVLTYVPPETAFDVASKSINDAQSEATQAQGILGYMDKLYEKYGEMATNTNEWAQALSKLKEVMPEINQFINEETGALTATNEQLREYVLNRRDALIEEAKAKAVRQLTEEYTQAGVDYYTAEINRDIAQEQANQVLSNIIDYIIRGHQQYNKDFGLTADEIDASLLDRQTYLKQLQEGTTNMHDLMRQAYVMADYMGEDYSMLEEYQRIYDDQIQATSDASTEMANLKTKMASLEADIQIANQALERMAAAAGSAASALTIRNAVTSGIGGMFLGSFDSGLDYVPRTGFALIHPGERIETAAEASLRRQYGIQQPGLDYGTLGSAMWQNAPKMGGDVYLDGRIVGQVLSQAQGRLYRQLQRSGWQG